VSNQVSRVKARKADIIRVGDEIKIIKPFFFIRCGYPMDVKEETEKICNEYGVNVGKLMGDVGVNVGNDIGRSSHFYKICRELAYAKCKTQKFGGRTRSLYTEEIPEYLGISCRVSNIKYVKTGEYHPRKAYYGDEPDYDPAFLSEEKTHKLIKCFVYHTSIICADKWIEAVNVEKIVYKEE
jgi:hypothetical protein